MNDLIALQWTLLHQIPREPNRLSTRELYERARDAGHPVTKRTIERHLARLAALPYFGIGSDVERGTTYWFYPRFAAGLVVPTPDPNAALALVLARENLQSLLPAATLDLLRPYFDRADAVLDAEAGRRLGAWRRKVRSVMRGPTLHAPQVAGDVHAAVSEALLRERQLLARHRGKQAKGEQEQVLNPLGLVAKDGVLYLVASATAERSEVFQYALHRFAAARCLDAPATRPSGFSLSTYIEQEMAFSDPAGAEPVKLVADFDARSASHLRERPLAANQAMAERDDGRVRISATVADTAELRWWLRGFGEHVEVLAPRELRHEFRRTSKRLAGRYAKAASRG